MHACTHARSRKRMCAVKHRHASVHEVALRTRMQSCLPIPGEYRSTPSHRPKCIRALSTRAGEADSTYLPQRASGVRATDGAESLVGVAGHQPPGKVRQG
eukprot:2322848-Pleurochrysis_carterae.AAC.3